MAKKVAVDKVELKTPFVKKEDAPIKLVQAKNDLDNEILPLGEPNILEISKIPYEDVFEKIGKEHNFIDGFEDDFKGMYRDHILNSVDSLQTIERGKLDLVKELILNSQNLEAISLLKSIQTAENWKVNEIISKL